MIWLTTWVNTRAKSYHLNSEIPKGRLVCTVWKWGLYLFVLLILCWKQGITNGKAWCVPLCRNICKHVDAMWYEESLLWYVYICQQQWKQVRLLLSFINVSLGSFQIAFRNDWAGRPFAVSLRQKACAYIIKPEGTLIDHLVWLLV